MGAAYVVDGVTASTLRACNHSPQVAALRRRHRAKTPSPTLRRLARELGRSYAKVLPRIDCEPSVGDELLSQTDVFAAEPRGRSIRGDLITFVEDIRIRRWDVLLAGAGQVGDTTLFGRGVIADRRLSGKLAACDNFIIRFEEPDAMQSLYVYAFLCTTTGARAIKSCAYGSSIPRIRPDLIGDLPIPLPDDDTQKRVADMVRTVVEERERFLAELTAARRVIENLPEMREAEPMCAARRARCVAWSSSLPTLCAWNFASVGEALGYLTSRWKSQLGDVVPANGIFRGNRGARIPCASPHGVDFLSQRDVFLIRPFPRRVVRPDTPDELLYAPEGSLLLGGQGTLGEGELFGQVAVVAPALAQKAVSEHLLRIIPRQRRATAYAFLSSRVGLRLVRSAAVGTKLLSLRPDLLRALPFPDVDERVERQVDRHLSSALAARSAAECAETEAIRMVEEEVLPQWLA